jgi:hypothetical protein
MEKALGVLVGEYGYAQVYQALQKRMKDDYLVLKGILGVTHPGASSAMAQAAPAAQTGKAAPAQAAKNTLITIEKLDHTPLTQEPKKRRGRPPRAEPVGAPAAPAAPSEQSEVPQLVPGLQEEPQQPPKSSQEFKVWQKDQEQKKRAELDAQGITVASLLTKDNLERWLKHENRTFAYIAREYVGCRDHEVSAAAKAHGLESSTAAKVKAYARRQKK